jgi:hypothetical protein
MARQNLTEAGAQTQILERNSDGSLLIQVITPGWGSSGYYSADVLEAAAKDKVWPKGTKMFFDHPSASESEDRPERSVKDIAATLTEDARWDGKRLVARADPVGLGKTVFADEAFRKAVACSVRASAEMNIGEAEGKSGWIVEKIHPGTFNSVDFVTYAGRGGMILEAARQAAAQEAGELDSDRRDKFRNAVRDAHAEDGVDVWVEDYDDTTVYWDRWGGDDPGTFSQTYKETDSGVELTGDPVKVRVKRTYVAVDEAGRAPELTREAALTAIREARNVGQWMESRIHLGFTQIADDLFGQGRLTREERIALSSGIGDALDAFTTSVEKAAPQLYNRDLWDDPETLAAVAETATTNVPVHPAGQSTPPKEHNMPEIEESRLQALEEAHGRVPTLEAERDSARAELATAQRDLAVEKAKSYAREFGTKRVREANSELAGPVVERIVAEAMREIPLNESDSRLDTEAFGAQVDEARKEQELYLATVIENSAGTVRGLGPVGEKKEVTRSDAQRAIDEAFGRKTQTQEV